MILMPMSTHDYEQLVIRTHGAVFAYAARRVGSERAEDITAETFLVAWRRRSDIPETPLPWLYGVARKVIANEVRGRQRKRRLTERIASVSAQFTAAPDVADPSVARALRLLSQPEREALLLVAWEGLDPAEAAVAAGCSAATFRVRLHRAKKRFSRTINQSTGKHREPRLEQT
jgi:RNA polymerase sigma factor (sigma-70 family)